MPNVRARRAISLALIRIAQIAGGRKRRRGPRRLPRQIYPRTLEREYARELIALVDRVDRMLGELKAELPALVDSAARDRMDAGEGRRVNQLLAQLQQRMEQEIRQEDIERLARIVAERTEQHQRTQMRKQVRSAFGADVLGTDANVAGLVDGFVAENVALIKSVTSTVLDKVEQATTRAFASATPHPQLARELTEITSLGKKRAKVIARDQVGKLYGQVNAARQKAMGVTRFTWVTVHDERVRPAHRALDGTVWKYSEPPSEGLPGTPIMCRCTADPVFDDLLADL